MAPAILLECGKQKKVNKGSLDSSVTMMGKTHKFSKGGYSSGFVPDYRHTVETMGESDGFGNSGRADSEDSCTPKRKCISLNVDRSDWFHIPKEVFSLSKISPLERRDLEIRFRAELEQIQSLQRRILSMGGNGAVISSTSNLHAPKHKSALQSVPKLKRGLLGRFESLNRKEKHAPTASSTDARLLNDCEALLKKLFSHKFCWVFKEPVDVVKLEIPDYFTVIKHPMDLGTVRKKLSSGAYASPWDFLSDVRLTFTNAMAYNPPGNNVHIMADTLNKFFEVRWKNIEKKLSASNLSTPRETEKEISKSSQPSKKRKVEPPVPNPVVPEVIVCVKKVSPEEKHKLSGMLESLLGELPDYIIDFLRNHSDKSSQIGEDEIEIDIDALTDDTIFELQKLLDDYLRGKKLVGQAKADNCAVEMLNESGVSNSSLQPLKANEPAEEDVDIGENDPPMSNYPPVEIEKDTAVKGSRFSSSSSSSSGSDSSSSESDSGGSSSESGSENAKEPAPTSAVKEPGKCVVNLDQEKSDLMNPINANCEPEEDAPSKAASFSGADGQEGENAPSERQVSPEKQIRMALLKNRFADTILKAREKALDKVEKGDPEKLRREKEELERQKREDKARIQAEAKAAEEARRQVQAAVAAEAKRQRELEREAARQALLKIEKTVEINENSRFLKDLEMLRAAPGEQLPSSVDETSPDHSQEGIGGFKLGGCNPLEQLGLYMKEDDEEEEDVGPL